jgi:uncharacterized damage-inducible protein DinB
MNKSDVLTLFEYNYWANARILDAASNLHHEQFVAPQRFSHGSLRGTLTHILGAEAIWRMRCGGVFATSLLPEDEFADLDSLRQRWAEEEGLMRQYLAGVTDEVLNAKLVYKNTKGTPFENTLWKLLAHLANHGTQHRAEAAVALTDYGHSPGDIDMVLFFREKNA